MRAKKRITKIPLNPALNQKVGKKPTVLASISIHRSPLPRLLMTAEARVKYTVAGVSHLGQSQSSTRHTR
ncbi:MAG: hypothetical protein MUC92_04895 [Fimbriimonadaceae bacterium]|nr:hypothetical protein [Fimbriimonadaceae bacterium]